ncbi:MAG: P-loop NTPase fold protein [Anaerolineales bacterium]
MEMIFTPDEPVNFISNDRLKMASFSRNIWHAIQHTQPPFVFGVLGDWGTGKTSSLYMLKELIQLKVSVAEETNLYIPIWFNAWQYENETNHIYPLLYSIKRDYELRVKGREPKIDFMKSLAHVSILSTLALTDLALRSVTNKVVGDAMGLDDIAKHFEAITKKEHDIDKVLRDWGDCIAELHNAYTNLLDQYAADLSLIYGIGESKIRFVIIIDDLDRCLPGTTIGVLEGIKNYLSNGRCIYVLGLNQKIVYEGIKLKYSGLTVDGREYLEKILNYSFNIPSFKASIPNFVIEELTKLVINGVATEEQKRYFKSFGNVISECNFNNPRKIKRILNRFLFFLDSYRTKLTRDDKELELQIRNAVRFIILAEYFPQIFQLYIKNWEKAEQELIGLIATTSSIEAFENKYRINIAGIYSLILEMENLFRVERSLTIPATIRYVVDILNPREK